MITFLYRTAHRLFSKPAQRGEYSGGKWQEDVRSLVLARKNYFTGNVLEVGCGEGLFLRDASQRYPKAAWWGGDNHFGRAAAAGAACGTARVAVFDAGALPFAGGAFSTVLCLNVFFNLPSLAHVSAALGEFARVCRTGGRVIFDYRSAHNPFLRLKYASARVYDPTVRAVPLRTYRDEEIRNLLVRHGLTLSGIQALHFPPRCPAIIIVEAHKK